MVCNGGGGVGVGGCTPHDGNVRSLLGRVVCGCVWVCVCVCVYVFRVVSCCVVLCCAVKVNAAR